MRELKGTPERRAIVAAALRRRKAKLKEAGLCQDCGAEKAAKTHTLCRHCLRDRRNRERTKTRLRWRAALEAQA
jgi:ribosomal protein S14